MVQDPSLLDEFEMRGRWWLPGKPEAVHAGTLYYKPEGSIRLELMGAFEQLQERDGERLLFPLPPIRRQFILGRTERGKECTLYGTLERRNLTSLMPELQVCSSILVSNLFVGAHFADEQALELRTLRASFTHFEEWLGIDPFGAGFNFLPLPSELGAPLELRLPYLRKKIFESEIPSLGVAISAYSNVGWRSGPEKTLTLLHNVYLLIEAGTPRDLAWYLKLMNTCTQFLAFVIGEPIYATRLVTHSGDAETHLYRTPRPRGRGKKKLGAVGLPFGQIQSVIPMALQSWIENADKFRPVYEFALAAHFADRLNLQAEFLDLAQALEIFHRRRFGKRYHFNQRLQGLLDELWGPTKSQVVGQDSDFVARVDRTRNYLIHYYENFKGKVLDDASGYFEANKRLRALLFIGLCKLIGINEGIASAYAFGSGEAAVW